MEITTTSGGASARMPELVVEAWTTPVRRRRVLLVVSLMALLAFFVLGRESASAVWEIASAKLVAINNGGGRHSFPSHPRPRMCCMHIRKQIFVSNIVYKLNLLSQSLIAGK